MYPRNLRRLSFAAVLGLLLFLCAVEANAGPGGFVYTGNLNTARCYHTATLLNNGMVLIAGGMGGCQQGNSLSSAELYNPNTGRFTVTGSLRYARYYHTATLLNNGKVLIVGGLGGVGGGSGVLSSAELYDPATGTFSGTGNLNVGRYFFTATQLGNGMVLIAGGECGGCVPSIELSSAELYNPATGTFTVTGSLSTARSRHTATLLNNGMVLVAGGLYNCCNLPSAELYNPTTGSFALTGSLNTTPRYHHTATLLNNGKALTSGGTPDGAGFLTSAEVYDPASGRFSNTGSLTYGRFVHTSTLLTNGTVLVAGGSGSTGALSSSELYDLATGNFTLTGSLNTGRYYHTATLLGNGMVLVAGGVRTDGTVLSSAELYQPTSTTPTGLLSITLSPGSPWVPLGSSLGLIATGNFSGGGTQSLASVIWTSSNNAVATVTNDSGDSRTFTSSNRGNAYGVSSGSATITACAGSVCGSTTLTVAPHNNLLIGSGGGDSGSFTFERWSETGTLVLTGNLDVGRSGHSALEFPGGNILLAGGAYNSLSLEVINQNGTVLFTNSLNAQRVSAAAALLGNGNEFICAGTNSPNTWEIRGQTGAFVSSGTLAYSRGAGTAAVVLPNGNIWISGGASASATWEVRDQNGNLIRSGNLQNPRSGAKVILLTNGNLMLVGGDTPATWEIDSEAGVLVSSGNLFDPRDGGSGAVKLANGNIFMFGASGQSSGTWEIHGQSGNLVSQGTLNTPEGGATAALQSNGNVFIAGGATFPNIWQIYSPTGALVATGGTWDNRAGGHSQNHF